MGLKNIYIKNKFLFILFTGNTCCSFNPYFNVMFWNYKIQKWKTFYENLSLNFISKLYKLHWKTFQI